MFSFLFFFISLIHYTCFRNQLEVGPPAGGKKAQMPLIIPKSDDEIKIKLITLSINSLSALASLREIKSNPSLMKFNLDNDRLFLNTIKVHLNNPLKFMLGQN